MRGRPWSVDEERQLRQLVEGGQSLDEIAKIMGKTRVSVKSKLFNSGLNSVKGATGVEKSVAVAVASSPAASPAVLVPAPASVAGAVVDADLKVPEWLPSVEEELKVLSAAIAALRQPGLCRAEVSRLHNIIVGVKVYQELFAQYVDYRGLEAEVLELRRALACENAKAPK
jgi:hypothetical protein